jgi:hypothetical protein
MSTATQRLKATSNHFQSQANMAANNFYSVVAGVGAGTGMLIVFHFQVSTCYSFILQDAL